MDPTRELVDEIEREKVLQARRMTFEQKILAGPRLFDLGCRMVETGIRAQHPDFSPAQVRQELDRRLAIRRIVADRPDAGVQELLAHHHGQ